MILTGKEIKKQVMQGKINIDPFVEKHLNPNSYNYRLGDYITIVDNETSLGSVVGSKSVLILIPEEGFLLDPGKVYLGSTYETIGSHHYVTSLIGRSSVGRLGLFLQISADLGNLGPAHCWTLELTCVQPIKVYPRMIIGQVSFWKPLGEIKHYRGNYTSFDRPQNCLYQNLK